MDKKLTLWRISNHEFSRSLRRIRNEIPRLDIVRLLIGERQKCLAKFVRGLSIGLVGVLLVESKIDSGLVEANIYGYNLSIPAIYVILFVAAVFAGSMINAFSYIHLNEFVRRAVNTLFGFDNAPAFGLFFNGDDAWTLGLAPQYRFFKSRAPHKLISSISLVFALAPVLLVSFYTFWVVASISFETLLEPNVDYISSGRFVAIVCIILVIYPAFWILVQFFALPFSRNVGYVRWSFLFPIHKHGNSFPKELDRWLERD